MPRHYKSYAFFTNCPKIKNIVIEEGNPYFYFENNILYSSFPNEEKWMLWTPGTIQGDYFRLPDYITCVHSDVLKSIETETLDMGRNSHIIEYIGENVKHLHITPGVSLFGYPSSFDYIYIPKNPGLETITIDPSDTKNISLDIEYCENLKYITIDREMNISSISIEYNGSPDLTFRVYKDTPAHKFLEENSLPYELIE